MGPHQYRFGAASASGERQPMSPPSTVSSASPSHRDRKRYNGITCNAICPVGFWPGATANRGRAKAAGIPVQQAREDLLCEKQPMLEFNARKIIALAIFRAGSSIDVTGTALLIDGGWVAQ